MINGELKNNEEKVTVTFLKVVQVTGSEPGIFRMHVAQLS
jgi:hypothetical protein